MLDEITNKTKFRYINFIADKGYIMKTENKEKLLKKGAKMITPYKKNQIKISKNGKKTKKINTKREKEKLKNRFKIEHVNQTIKKYNRLNVRKDKLACTYQSFTFLGIGLNIFS